MTIPHDRYLELNPRNFERRKAYRGLFKMIDAGQLIDNEIRMATNGNYVLGSTKFQE